MRRNSAIFTSTIIIRPLLEFSLFSSLSKGDPQRPRSRRLYSWRETGTEHLGLKRCLSSTTTGLGQRWAA